MLSVIFYVYLDMYKGAFIYNYDMYRWHSYNYASMRTIGCHQYGVLLVDFLVGVMCVYVEIV